ncbi:MAG: hypothetical protein IJT38_04080 [Clostridia bacterium]|nr:hypothetical protein [Clostridia bacterium]
MLKRIEPDSEGKRGAIARARHLTEFRWTPLLDVPTYTKETGKTVLKAGVEVTGMPYSSTEPTDKFITENVTFETFLSIIENPDSALYQKDLKGHGNSWTYFGVVCNGLVRYALNIKRRYSTRRWGTIPGMYKVADCGAYTPEQIELCDVLYAFGARSHVALITGLFCDGDGKIEKIEVSEAIRPVCVRRCFTVEEFYKEFEVFALWRYELVDSLPPSDPDIDKLLFEKGAGKDLPDIAVDYGNKSNYPAADDVVISAFAEGQNNIELYKNGELKEKINIKGRGKIAKRIDTGYYTARLAGTEKRVEFCVNKPEVSFDVSGGQLAVNADPCDKDSKILYMEFRAKPSDMSRLKVYYDKTCGSLVKVEELTDEEIKSGKFTRQIPDEATGFKVYFINKYGVWTHIMIDI